MNITESENTKHEYENTDLINFIRITKAKIIMMITAIILPLTSLFFTLELLTQGATQNNEIYYGGQ